MMSIKKSTLFIFIFLVIFLVLIFSLTKFEKSGLKEGIKLKGLEIINLHKVDSGIYRSDQPSGTDFAILEGYGIREVLNLRWFFSDDRKAKKTSLTLHHIPMNALSITEEQLIESMRIIRDRKGPILIHCFHGADRTGAVVALYRMVFQGVSKEDAIREMKEGGYGHHNIYTNITRMLENIDVDKIREELHITNQKQIDISFSKLHSPFFQRREFFRTKCSYCNI